MISIIADIIGIASGVLSILSFKENCRTEDLKSTKIYYNIHIKTPSYSSTGGQSLLDGEAVIMLWILGFFLCVYVYNNYRYWLMPVAATIVLLITLMVYFFFKSKFCIRSLPNKTFWIYIFSVVFTAATIACTAMVQQPSFGNADLFHASQIFSIIMSTLVLAILAWRMISFSRGRMVNLNRLDVAVVACFVSFLLASGLIEKIADNFKLGF